MCVLVKVEPADLAANRHDQQRGFDTNEARFGCFVFAWFQDGLAAKQEQLSRLNFALLLLCPNISAYRQQSFVVMPVSLFWAETKSIYVSL